MRPLDVEVGHLVPHDHEATATVRVQVRLDVPCVDETFRIEVVLRRVRQFSIASESVRPFKVADLLRLWSVKFEHLGVVSDADLEHVADGCLLAVAMLGLDDLEMPLGKLSQHDECVLLAVVLH